MRTFFLAVLFVWTMGVGTLRAAACSAGPGVWNEGDAGQGDAGRMLGTANVTIGVGSLTTICGNISQTDGTGVDLYEIMIVGTTFTATATDRGASTLDPMLYLFDENGKALFANDNNGGQTTDSQIFTNSITPGLYFLAIAPAGQEGLNKNDQLLFPVTGSTTTITPSSTPKVLKDWNDGGGNTSGRYIVSLDGASFAQEAPEPATFPIAAAALLALAALRRRV